ncbi:hypothetical protein [Glutamicibacter protophormiae]|uniref:hypothetical protein n=1 Tax=Glutamicibacter protophormiae TaxID=37930 RepID=UPI00195D57DF|nr:hypothetical protein [Glutamicibacter protophormiae]QRQ79969.1 hypothetical protein JQN66_07120 [Glutamicibacter protophormiae]
MTRVALGVPVTGHQTGSGFHRIASAWCAPVAIGLIALSNSVYASLNSEGLDDQIGANLVSLYSDDQTLWYLCTVTGLLGSLLLVPGILAVVKALRLDRPVLSLVAGSIMIAGYISYFGIMFTTFDTLDLVRIAPQAAETLVDESSLNFASAGFFLLFVIGNLFGTALLGVCVLLSRSVPRWSGVLLLCWTLGHITNLLLLNEWFAVIGGLIAMAGFAVIAVAITKMTNQQWLERS